MDVAIIGAGISGLECARRLRKKYPSWEIRVFEATDIAGGRIKSIISPNKENKNGSRLVLNAGAEFLHGRECKSTLDEILKSTEFDIKELRWPDYIYYQRNDNEPHKLFRYDEAIAMDKELAPCVHACYDLKHLPLSTEAGTRDISMSSYLKDKIGIPDRLFELMDATFANDMGEMYSLSGLDELIIEDRNWESGDDYLVVRDKNGIGKIIEEMIKDMTIHYNWIAKKVTYFPSTQDFENFPVLVENSRGGYIRCRKVIVTASLGVLKEGLIEFSPPLPVSKQKAIERIGFAKAIKIFLQFSSPFWPKDFFNVVCASQTFPEFWVSKSSDEYSILTFFAMGSRAEKLAQIGDSEIERLCLEQIHKVFQTYLKGHNISHLLVDCQIFRWTPENQPFVRGGYSYPTINAAGQREVLRQPLSNQVFFAGEACNININPCIQGALESANYVCETISSTEQAE